MNMFHRPKVGETEEDLLKQQEEFLKASKKQVPFKRKNDENEPQVESSTSKRFEILGDIKEKTFDVYNPIRVESGQTKGFPKSFTIDPTMVHSKKGKKSLFAMQLEKNKKVADIKMEVEETKNDLKFDSDCSGEKKKIHEENLKKLSMLSEAEILEEQKKLLNTLDPKLVEFLKLRGKEKKPMMSSEVKMDKNSQPTPLVDEVKTEKGSQQTPLVDEEVKRVKELQQTPVIDEEEVKKNLEKYLDSKWVNMDFLEKEKLEWIGDIPDKKSLEPDQPYSARFDFKGDLQPFKTEIDVRNSLYHHGDEPHRPGYTIQELYQLSRSHVLQQRNIALTTLANIIRKTKLGYYDKCFDGQLLHKLVESDLFFLLRFSIDENCLWTSSIYCLHNFLCNESDEFCLDKLLGVLNTDVQPLIYNKMEASKDEETELKDHVVIGCDMIKGVLRTDLLVRLSYGFNNFSSNRETIIRIINCLIRISRHSFEATTSILQTNNLLEKVYDCIKSTTPVYEGVKLFRIIISHSKKLAAEIVQSFDFRFLVTFIEAEENENISKKEFYLLKLESLYLWRGLLSHDIFVNDFLTWSPCLIRLLLFYTQKVDLTDSNDFDFELFSALTSLIIICNKKKLPSDPNIVVLMRVCLEKWLTQLIQLPQCTFAVSKALGCAFRYFTSHFKSFGVTVLDLEYVKKVNTLLSVLFQSESFGRICFGLIRSSYLLSPTKVTRDPDNLPSLCSVYYGGEEFLRIVQNYSPLPFCISIVKYLNTTYNIYHETKSVIKSFIDSQNIQKYISKVFYVNEKIYNWFMKFEIEFLIGVLKLLFLLNDKEGLNLGFCLPSFMRVDDVKTEKVLKILCETQNWRIEVDFLKHLASLYSELLLQKREKVGVVNYKNDFVPEDWPYKILAHLKGKEAVQAVINVLKFISLILDINPILLRRVPYTYRFYNLCSVFLTDSNVFETEIQNALDRIFSDILDNQEKVNLNMKFDKKKSFYDLYTELIIQYAGVSYGLPIFAKLVLFPLQNRFNVSFRKLIWFEYLHVLRVVTLSCPISESFSLRGFVEPCETDESLLVAYINSVSNNVITKTKNGFVYNIAVGNVCNFLKSTNQDETLFGFLKKKVEDLKNEELKNDILNFTIV